MWSFLVRWIWTHSRHISMWITSNYPRCMAKIYKWTTAKRAWCNQMQIKWNHCDIWHWICWWRTGKVWVVWAKAVNHTRMAVLSAVVLFNNLTLSFSADNPVYKEIPRQQDRNYILSNLSVNHSLKTLSLHISSDFFWRKCFQQRWKTYQSQPVAERRRPWINIYMERHLQQFIEKLQPDEYELETVQSTLDICAAYINQLEINYLQPVMDGSSNGRAAYFQCLSRIIIIIKLVVCCHCCQITFHSITFWAICRNCTIFAWLTAPRRWT